jgi:hypothetical protein
MTKPAPTLADSLIREWSRPHYRHIDPNNWLATHIVQARKFVLDKSMSAFMADLSYVSLNAAHTQPKRRELVEGMRKLARLPHAATWIEYDKREHRRRVKEFYHPEIDASPDAVPDYSGWLLMQHPKLETAFMSIHCTSHSWDARDARTDKPNCSQFAVAWTCDDGVPPWPRDPHYHRDHDARIDDTDKLLRSTPAGILTGVLEYRTDTVSVIPNPHFSKMAVEAYTRLGEKYFNPLGELAHDLRYLWSLLATINDLPTSLAEVKQDRGYVSRGRYRKFSDHTVISLTVPAKRYATVAKRAIAIARRRGHQVRGHWRKDRWHPGERIWIAEHVRGDTSIGFVLHDYTVEHPVDKPGNST